MTHKTKCTRPYLISQQCFCKQPWPRQKMSFLKHLYLSMNEAKRIQWKTWLISGFHSLSTCGTGHQELKKGQLLPLNQQQGDSLGNCWKKGQRLCFMPGHMLCQHRKRFLERQMRIWEANFRTQSSPQIFMKIKWDIINKFTYSFYCKCEQMNKNHSKHFYTGGGDQFFPFFSAENWVRNWQVLLCYKIQELSSFSNYF